MKKRLIAFITALIFIFGSLPVSLAGADMYDSPFLATDADKSISMDFKNADLNDVLKIFSQQSGLNFIAAQDVTAKKVTLYLDNVPVEEALDRILQANNLTYDIKQGSGIFVVKNFDKAPELVTRVYYFKHATVNSSKFNKTIEIKIVSDDEESSTEEDSTGSGSEDQSGIVAAIEGVVTALGKITQDPRTNSIIVTDIPSQFPIIERTIARLDVPVPQIVIEVEMLDVSKTNADKIGIKYGEQPLLFSGASRSHLYPFAQNNILEKGRFAFSTDGSSDDSEFSVGTLSAAGMTAALQFLKTQTDTRNLARPRILTLNNQTAEIKIATSEAIGLQTSTDASEGVATQTVSAERVQTGVFLTVTPQVNLASNEITMAIAPKVIQARTGATFQGQTFKDPEERGTKSILRVQSGETIVLGGLLRTDDSDTRTKMPFLADIPLIGGAFRHKDNTATERELIIFITPRILNDTIVAQGGTPMRQRQIDQSLNKYYLSREQDDPSDRIKNIEQELKLIENQRL